MSNAVSGGGGEIMADVGGHTTRVTMEASRGPSKFPRRRRHPAVPPCICRQSFTVITLAVLLTLIGCFAITLMGFTAFMMPGAYTSDQSMGLPLEVGSHAATEDAHRDESVVADRLKRQVRVLCWVMTSPDCHEKKARHVKATWGKRCNTLLFMSGEEDADLGTIKLDAKEGRNYLWDLTKAAFGYIHAHHREDADWFLKADDDTYVIVENLRFLLSAHNASEPVYFGSRHVTNTTGSYLVGGPGYVLSKRALDLFVKEGPKRPGKCNPDKCNLKRGDYEDVEIGKCMASLGVLAGDSRDAYGRSRFFQMDPEYHLFSGDANITPPRTRSCRYYRYSEQDSEVTGLNGLSDTAISFHKIAPSTMYLLDYLLYHLRPYGISSPHLRHAGAKGQSAVDDGSASGPEGYAGPRGRKNLSDVTSGKPELEQE